MVDFGKMKVPTKECFPLHPCDIFYRLPKPERFIDLHKSQAEVLNEWFDDRAMYKDFVVKLQTGSGKTLVGLLMALSTMRELGQSALYLVENRQLAAQVVGEANELGIPAIAYTTGASKNADFRNGRAVLVASYEALFNGLSAFGRIRSMEYESVGIIIFDDAHSAFSALRDAFTVTICAEDDRDLYTSVCGLFRNSFAQIDRSSTFDEFLVGIGSTGTEILEVPFWAWLDKAQAVAHMLSKKHGTLSSGIISNTTVDSLKFAWPLIKDELKYCRALMSRNAFTITPYLPIVDLFPTYSEAPRRVYMSATFADDGAIIRSFETDGNNLPKTLSPHTFAGVGRRMILPLDADKASEVGLLNTMKSVSASGKGVVVLTESAKRAEEWDQGNVVVAKKENVENVISYLRGNKKTFPVVFANRYNGMDLPGDACRLLILDGVPKGVSDYDKLSASTLSSSSLYARNTAQTIEQALGRGTRGTGDYCSVVLKGTDLINWISDKNHLKFFSLPTQAQIICGNEILESIENEDDYFDTLNQGVEGNLEFASYLASYVANYMAGKEEAPDERLVTFARCERRVFRAWRHGDESNALRIARDFGEKETNDGALRGYMFQLAAQIAYSCGLIAEAGELQKRAYGLNRALMKSVALASSKHPSKQALSIVNAMERIASKEDAVASFDERTCHLASESSPDEFEAHLRNLGEFLGLEAIRCDKNGDGPDVLWRFPSDGFSFVMEAKNNKEESNPLSKKEHGQLLVAKQWFEEEYPGFECICVSVHANNKAYYNASATNTHVLTIDNLQRLRDETRILWTLVSSCSLGTDEKLALCDAHLDERNLRREGLIKTYFELFSVASIR